MNKSIIITEKEILNAVNEMCVESLSPDTFEKWEEVKKALAMVRKNIINENMKTINNLHNFRFKETKFFTESLANDKIYLRQIFFDTKDKKDLFFALNIDNMNLFLYKPDSGTKNKPDLVRIGDMPVEYSKAIRMLCELEYNIIEDLKYESKDYRRQ